MEMKPVALQERSRDRQALEQALLLESLQGSLLGGQGLLLSLHGGLFVSFSPPQLCENPCLLTLFPKSFYGHLEGFIFPHPDSRHFVLDSSLGKAL